MSPLILTLLFEPDDQARFERLRQLHFPPERNQVPAHVTLFHALPGARLAEIDSALREACAAVPACKLVVTGLRSLGRGTAYVLDAGPVAALRAGLARRWEAELSAQDRQRWSPHLTVQNKVTAAAAAELLAAMRPRFAPFEVGAAGLRLWRYLGGPWEEVSEHRFRPCQAGIVPPEGRP